MNFFFNFSHRISACTVILLAFLPLLKTVHAQRLWRHIHSEYPGRDSTHKIRLKPYLLAGSALFVSGMLDGTIESISFHYHTGFKPHFPNADDQFWNPELSWKNKYKNGDPAQGPKFFGSATIFVFTTDAYHALRTSRNIINTVTLVYYIHYTRAAKKPSKKMWKKITLDVVALTAVRSAGFNLIYSLLLKRQS